MKSSYLVTKHRAREEEEGFQSKKRKINAENKWFVLVDGVHLKRRKDCRKTRAFQHSVSFNRRSDVEKENWIMVRWMSVFSDAYDLQKYQNRKVEYEYFSPSENTIFFSVNFLLTSKVDSDLTFGRKATYKTTTPQKKMHESVHLHTDCMQIQAQRAAPASS